MTSSATHAPSTLPDRASERPPGRAPGGAPEQPSEGAAEPVSERRPGRPRYLPLFERVVASNAILLVAACTVTVLVLAPRKISSVAVDEALVLAGSLALVALINIVLVRRAVAPLQAVNALARRVDLANPGERIPAAKPTSEAGELALTFNEMLTRLELERLESTRRVLAAHESERLRIAQELHDEIGQSLTAVLLQLGRVRARLPAHLKDELDDAQEAARDSLEGVRRIAIELRPETLDDLGLASALATLSDGFGQRAGLRVVQDIQPELPQLSREAELVVYRVAQEALTNVARHSGSGTAELTVAADEQTLTLSIRDHGRGLPVGSVTDGNGVRGMRERAGLVGAELRLGAPAAGEGTELRLTLPLESAA